MKAVDKTEQRVQEIESEIDGIEKVYKKIPLFFNKISSFEYPRALFLLTK